MSGLSGTPAQLSALMASEAATWKRVIEAAKITLE